MATHLITLSTKKLDRDTAIVLSLIFGVIYAGLGNTYLGAVDRSADTLALAVVLLWAFCGWLAFLILVRVRWKTVGVLSFPSHVIVTLAIGVTCSVITWPPSIALMYSSRFGSVLAFLVICGVCAAIVALLTYAAYMLALRSVEKDKRRNP